MKQSHGMAMVGTALLLAAAHSQAQSVDQASEKWYADIDAGVALEQNAPTKSGSNFGSNGSIHFNPGVRGGLGLGYNLNQSFAVEMNAGVVWNSIDQIGANKLSSVGASAQLEQIPLLVNGIYRLPFGGNFKPYVGAGVGGVVGVFDSSNVPLSFFPGNDPHYNDTAFSFAYQIETGFKYPVGEKIDLGLAYKFLGTTGYSWSDNNINFKTSSTMTHAIEATFIWRF
jgi:opacity protein-like surface antigen